MLCVYCQCRVENPDPVSPDTCLACLQAIDEQPLTLRAVARELWRSPRTFITEVYNTVKMQLALAVEQGAQTKFSYEHSRMIRDWVYTRSVPMVFLMIGLIQVVRLVDGFLRVSGLRRLWGAR